MVYHWIIVIIVLPLVAALFTFFLPQRGAIVTTVTGITISAIIAWVVGPDFTFKPVRYPLGGWGPALGIELYADGLSVIMLAMTAAVGVGVTLYASEYFSGEHSTPLFWPLWLILWAALNGLFLSADIFNVYITLELVGLSAVALVALAQNPGALGAAMRYLLVSLFGSLCYLLGVALLYAEHATLEFSSLYAGMSATPAAWAALALMSAGLIMKAALFPLHFWLPPAHSSAPAPVSALLSALVVKGAVYLLLRLWWVVFANIVTGTGTQMLGALGALAILWGSLQALRAERLKLLIAYSTVAQIGYLFLVFPLAPDSGGMVLSAGAGVVFLALSHALAKAAVFTSAGNILRTEGHDRVKELGSFGHRYPVTTFTIAIAGMSLIGLPPSGGFLGKWLLLEAAYDTGQWWWILAILLGSLIAAAYIFRIISHTFVFFPQQKNSGSPLDWRLEWPSFVLALIAFLLGLLAYPVHETLNIGSVFNGGVGAGTAP